MVAFMIVCMLFIINGISYLAVQGGFQELEVSEAISDSKLFNSFLQESINQLDANVYDYAAWDDTYEFIDSKDPNYLESNFVPSTFESLSVNFIIILDPVGNILYGQGYDLESGKYFPVSTDLLDLISKDNLLTNHESEESSVSGVVKLAGYTSLISSRPILTSNEEGPIKGTMIMGRYMDAAAICSLCEITQKSMVFVPFNDPQLPANIWSPSGDDLVTTRVLDADVIEGFYPVRDIYGLPSVIIKSTTPRTISKEGSETVYLFVFSIISTGLIFGLLLMVFLDRSLLNRLSKLNINVNGLGSEKELSARLDSEGKDEISDLSSSINNMLDKIDESYNEVLLQKSRGNALLEALPDVVLHMKRDGSIIHRNFPKVGNLEYLSSIDADNIFDILPEDASRLARRRMNEVNISGNLGSVEYNFELGDVMLNLESRLLAYGEDDLLAVISDNSDRKKVENALIDTKLAAEESNRVKSEFLANMSHELRTPLNSVIGFSDILLEGIFGEMNERQAKYVLNIQESGSHLLNIVNDILDISKVEAGKMDVSYEEVSLHEVLNNVSTMVSPLANKKNIKVSQNIDQNALKIVADRGKLIQMLYNLAGNAVKFTPDNGSIDLGTKIAGEYLDIFVQDSGIGITKENMEKLFDPFVQLDSAAARNYKGTGLGLALVKKFAEMHGGMVHVDSEFGKGSTFTFSIPLDKEIDTK